MTPTHFAESNKKFAAPPDMTDSQCADVSAYAGTIRGGSLDGDPVVVVAWQPSAQDIELIAQGNPIFLSCVGGLPPHFLSMSFKQATNPA
jgi:hypothetical protein